MASVRSLVPALLWACLVVALTSLPGPALPAPGPGLDKAVHFALYLVLGLLARWGVGPAPGRAGRAAGERPARVSGWLLVPALAIFAGLDELHQAWIPGRDPSVADWVADLAGAVAGVGLGAAGRASGGSGGRTRDRRSRDVG